MPGMQAAFAPGVWPWPGLPAPGLAPLPGEAVTGEWACRGRGTIAGLDMAPASPAAASASCPGGKAAEDDPRTQAIRAGAADYLPRSEIAARRAQA